MPVGFLLFHQESEENNSKFGGTHCTKRESLLLCSVFWPERARLPGLVSDPAEFPTFSNTGFLHFSIFLSWKSHSTVHQQSLIIAIYFQISAYFLSTQKNVVKDIFFPRTIHSLPLVSPSSHTEKAGFLILRTQCYKASSLLFYLVFLKK